MNKETQPRKKCYNCIYAGQSFKLGTVTHHHCQREGVIENKEDVSPWDTLRRVFDTCQQHQFKITRP